MKLDASIPFADLLAQLTGATLPGLSEADRQAVEQIVRDGDAQAAEQAAIALIEGPHPEAPTQMILLRDLAQVEVVRDEDGVEQLRDPETGALRPVVD